MIQKIEHEYISGIHVLRLRGDFSSPNLITLKNKVMEEAQATGSFKVLLNLDGVDYITSKDLGVFVQIFRWLNSNSPDFCLALCNLNNFVSDVIEMTKLENVFKVYRTESDAIFDLSQSSEPSAAAD